MKYLHGCLTEKQIRSTFFIVPPFAVPLAFDEANYARLVASRSRLVEAGGELLVIGWPDGTTMTYAAPIAGLPIDLECISEIYKATSALERASTP